MGFYNVNEALANYWPGWANEAAQLRQRAAQERAQPIPEGVPDYAERVEFAARKFDEEAKMIETRVAFARAGPGYLYLEPNDMKFRQSLNNEELINECKIQGRVHYGWPETDGHDMTALAKLQQGNVKP